MGRSSEITDTAILADGSIALLIARHMSYPVPDKILLQFRTADGTLDATRTGPPLTVTDSGIVRVSGIAATNDSVAVGLSGANSTGTYAATTQFSLKPLERGAGLVLQWDGGAFPTRWGSDPGPECPFDGPYWPDNDNARGITTVADKGGYEVDLFGGIHPFAIGRQHPSPAAAVGALYWFG